MKTSELSLGISIQIKRRARAKALRWGQAQDVQRTASIPVLWGGGAGGGDEIGRIRQLILSETRALAVTQDNRERHQGILSHEVTLCGFGFIRICSCRIENRLQRGKDRSGETKKEEERALKFIKGLVW